MEHQKILNSLDEANGSKYVTRKWNIVNDQSYGKYGGRNKIICNTELWKSNLYDYNDACILVIVTIADRNIPTKVAFSHANVQFDII